MAFQLRITFLFCSELHVLCLSSGCRESVFSILVCGKVFSQYLCRKEYIRISDA